MLSILKYPDPFLRKKTRPVDPAEPGLAELVEDMFQTMYAAEGVGLAANQVGRSERLAVIDVSCGKDPKARLVLLNPEVVERRGEAVEEEGCLSLPGLRAKTGRAAWVRVRAQDLSGREIFVEGEGLLGRALQHETDHLDGRLFIDRLGLAQKALISGKLKEFKSAAARGSRVRAAGTA